MGTIKAGRVCVFLCGGCGAKALFGGLFAKDGASVQAEVSWGDIPDDATDVQLSVRLHKASPDERLGECPDEDSDDSGFVDDGVLNQMPVTDYDGDGLDDGFSDGKMRAWAEYLGSDASVDDSVADIEVGLCEDPEAFMPESMIEDGTPDDDEFFAASGANSSAE